MEGSLTDFACVIPIALVDRRLNDYLEIFGVSR